MKKKSFFANKKNIFLAVVAFILVCMMSVGVTYSWIDDLKEVQISTTEDGENTPLTVGKNIHAEYQIGDSEENIINLGRMISKNDGKDVIDDEGYFYESGNMHLTPCYSDGKNFTVPTNSGTRTTHIDDNDVSFITVTLKITSSTAKSEFWFKGVPSFTYNKLNNSTEDDFEDDIDAMRVSITSDGATNVYSNCKNGDDYIYYSANGVPHSDGRGFKEYTYNNASNVSSTRGKNGNTLFSVGKGETKEVTFKIWLEEGNILDRNYPNYSSIDIDLKLVSSFTKTRTITIKNKTTGVTSSSWMFNDEAKLYVAIPAARQTSSWVKYNSSTNNYKEASYWDITTALDNNGEATIEVPASYNDEELLVFRCSNGGWNSQTHKSGTGAPIQRSDYSIYCWNFWSTKIPNTFKNESYTMYGSSYDGTVDRLYNGDWTFYNVNNKGYGTWDPVAKIYFDANKSGNSNQNHAYWENDGNGNTLGACNLFIEDFSDYSNNGHVYYYTMYPNNSNGNTVWTAYIPTSSTKISFRYNYDNGNTHKNHYWGFLVQASKGANVRSRQVYTTGYERPSDAYTFTSKSIPNSDGLAKGEWSTSGQQETTAATQATTATSSGTVDLGSYTVDSGMKAVYDGTEYTLYGVDSSISTNKIFKAVIPVTSTEQKELSLKNVGGSTLGLNQANQSFTLPRNSGSYTLYKGYNQTIYPVKVSGATGNYILTCQITQLDNSDASNINIISISKP